MHTCKQCLRSLSHCSSSTVKSESEILISGNGVRVVRVCVCVKAVKGGVISHTKQPNLHKVDVSADLG